jgi:hypothetical protein
MIRKHIEGKRKELGLPFIEPDTIEVPGSVSVGV